MTRRSILLSGLLLFCFACEKKAGQPSQASAPGGGRSGPRATMVDGFVVDYQSLEQRINATGNVIAYESVAIRPERSGKLVSLNFRESTYVKAGSLLGQIDDSELVAEKNRLDVQLELAEKEVSRGKELLQIEGISKEEMDRLENRVKDLHAQQSILDIQIKKSKIFAPFSGVLGLRQVSQGAYITPNDVLIELQQINPIKLEFDVPERYLSQVNVGQDLEFTVVGVADTFLAKVYALGAEISPTTRTFKVRARSQNSKNLLKPGQFAKITLVTGIDNEAILVPTDAIVPVLDGQQVFVARNGRAAAIKVETNDRQAEEVQIIQGLQKGDTVLVSALLSLSDGAMIRVSNLVNQQKPVEQ